MSSCRHDPGADAVTPDVGSLEGKRVMITGASGSFGRHFLRALLEGTRGATAVAYVRNEVQQAKLAHEFAAFRPRLRLFLGDIRNEERVTQGMYECDVVVHAAALKRVDDTAIHPYELFLTNVIGTKHVLKAAQDLKVPRVLVLTSDKCVEPVNSYGTSKLAAEQMAVAWNIYSYARGCRVTCLRYGNVLGSRGSVAHQWKRALLAGESLTITDPAMTRFWLTLDQAVEWACHALRIMRGGEIVVPRLPAMELGQVAVAAMHAFGKGPAAHTVRFTGKRPGGEKRDETLLSPHEMSRAVVLEHGWILEPDWELPLEREPWLGPRAAAGYTSDHPARWLPIEEMTDWLRAMPEEAG